MKHKLFPLIVGLINIGLGVTQLSLSSEYSWIGWINLILGLYYVATWWIFRILGRDDDGSGGGKPKPSTDDGRKGIEVISHD